MLIHLYKQATTRPKFRAAIQASYEPASVLAERFRTAGQTVCKWKRTDSLHDRSQYTALAANHTDPGARDSCFGRGVRGPDGASLPP